MPRKLSLTLASLIVSLGSSATAQIRPDSTLPTNSQIIRQQTVNLINGGTRRGSNLFHSFERFSLPVGDIAHFNNAPQIQNIFGRVTGAPSNIDGTLKVNGTANFFLINPKGIFFGPNATLDIGGSFLGTTADRIHFANGTQFNSVGTQVPALLTVSVPVGLDFTGNPGSQSIRVQGTGHNVDENALEPLPPFTRNNSVGGLRAIPGKTLALIGEDILLDGGILTAEQGRVELGGVEEGLVGLNSTNQGLSLSYSQVDRFSNIQLSSKALIDASGLRGGSVRLQGKHIEVNEGSFVLIQTLGPQPSGSINVSASESLSLIGVTPDGPFRSAFGTENLGIGKGGDINIGASQLLVEDGAIIGTRGFGPGEVGSLRLNIADLVRVEGFSPLSPFFFSTISSTNIGSDTSGNVELSARELRILDGGDIGSSTFGDATGGDVQISAKESIELVGTIPNYFTPSTINAATFAAGDAGQLRIDTGRLTLRDGASVSTSTVASGDAGSLTINARESIEVTGRVPGSISPSLIDSSAREIDPPLAQFLQIPPIPSGDSGALALVTNKLRITEGGLVSIRNDAIEITDDRNNGNRGLSIQANSIELLDQGSLSAATASRDGGNINIEAGRRLLLQNGSNITASAEEAGNGGNLNIDTQLLANLSNSTIRANAQRGRGGEIFVNTQGLLLSPGSVIDASSERGPEFGGIVQINTTDVDLSRTAAEPPTAPVTPTVSTRCQGASVALESSLVNPGTEGLPSSSANSLSQRAGWQESVSNALMPDSSLQKPQKSDRGDRVDVNQPELLVPANGWKQRADGKVDFIAAAGMPPDLQANQNCSSANSSQKTQ